MSILYSLCEVAHYLRPRLVPREVYSSQRCRANGNKFHCTILKPAPGLKLLACKANSLVNLTTKMLFFRNNWNKLMEKKYKGEFYISSWYWLTKWLISKFFPYLYITLHMLLLVVAVNSNIIEHEKWTATSGISEMMVHMLEWSLDIPQYILIKTRALPESLCNPNQHTQSSV